ncbi:MAG: type IV secretory system conjugative DNA transfer family protein [Rhodomicrobium sp.]
MKRFSKAQWGLVVLVLLIPAMAWAQYGNPYGGGRGMYYEEPWYTYRVAQHILAALLGALAGFLASQKMREFRALCFKWGIIGGIVIGAIAGAIVDVFLGDIVFFGLAAGVVWYMLREEVKAHHAAAAVKATTFGSAEWASLEHLVQHDLVGEKGFALGVYQKGGINYPLHYTGDRHLLTVAPTRSGKGVSAIVPNLLTYDGSCLVIDPKGENARITADRRGTGDLLGIESMNQTVHVVDPWGITGLPVARFNPMDWLKSDDEDISENAMMLADSIVTPHSGNRDQFWDEEAKALLMGLLLYVALDGREQESRTLGRVRDIICLGEDSLKDVMLQMIENPNPIISSTAERTLAKEAKLRSNVLASLQAHTHFLDSPRIRTSLSASDFRFEDLKTSKMTVYLVLPADRLDTFGRWLRLLIQQAITVNARNINIKPEKPILFLLDEMAALGRLTMVEQAFGLMAGFGMQLWGIVQDLSQLDRIYDKGWETFIGNSGVLQYFGSRDQKTAEYFSKLCGVTTIEKFSFTQAIARSLGLSSSSTSGGQGGGSSTSGKSEGESYTESFTRDVAQRHLAFPDELMVLRDNRQLVLIENFNPISGTKVLWHKSDKLKAMGVNLNEARVETKPQAKKITAMGPHVEGMGRQEALEKSLNSFIDRGGEIERNDEEGKIRVKLKNKQKTFSEEAEFEEWLLRISSRPER